MNLRLFLIAAGLLISAKNSYIEYKTTDRPNWMVYNPKTVYPRHKQKPYTKKMHLAILHTQNGNT